jgi:hypothetical protein
MVIRSEVVAEILRLHHAEKWPVGTIAAQLHVHHSVVTRVIATDGAPPSRPQRPARIDAYLPLVLESLRRYPGLLASRLYQMCKERGYRGSPDHFRHMVARHRPPRQVEAYLRTTALPGEHGQVDWAHFGKIKIGRAERPLLAFVCVLSYSRRIFLRFYLDQRLENFLRGHVAAFEAWDGLPRACCTQTGPRPFQGCDAEFTAETGTKFGRVASVGADPEPELPRASCAVPRSRPPRVTQPACRRGRW